MYFPVGKWFHIEIRFLRTILSLGAGVNGDQPSSLAWTPKCHSQYCFPIKVSSKVQITSLCTNSWGSPEKCSFHKMGSHKHSLFGLNSVGPTFKIQDTSHKNLDFWLLLKRLRSGNTGPIFPRDNWAELHVPSGWPESSLLPIFLTPNLFSVPCLPPVGSCVDIRHNLCPSSLCSLLWGE